jgi:hypothetical protein
MARPARAVAQEREMIRTAGHGELGLGQAGRTTREIDQRHVAEAETALIVKADADEDDAVFDIFEVPGDALAVPHEHRGPVLIGKDCSWKPNGGQRSHEDELSDSHAA